MIFTRNGSYKSDRKREHNWGNQRRFREVNEKTWRSLGGKGKYEFLKWVEPLNHSRVERWIG